MAHCYQQRNSEKFIIIYMVLMNLLSKPDFVKTEPMIDSEFEGCQFLNEKNVRDILPYIYHLIKFVKSAK